MDPPVALRWPGLERSTAAPIGVYATSGVCKQRGRPGSGADGTWRVTVFGCWLLATGVISAPTRAADGERARTRSAFTSIEGEPLPLASYAGRPLLVVNTASMCGYTYQYAALQRLWAAYRERGLVVLGVPSNDFGGQEPGSAAEIKTFCEVNFDVDFPLTEKVHVKGEASHPLFTWLRQQLGRPPGRAGTSTST